MTDVAAVESAVVQYTPSYIAEAIPKAVLCGMMSQRVDYPAYLALVTAAYRVISEDVRAAAETHARITRENQLALGQSTLAKEKQAAELQMQRDKTDADRKALEAKTDADRKALEAKTDAEAKALEAKTDADTKALVAKTSAEIARAKALNDVEVEAKKAESKLLLEAKRKELEVDAQAKSEAIRRAMDPARRAPARAASARVRLTADVSEIEALWRQNFAGAPHSRDELVVCTLHMDKKDYHATRITDCCAFNTQRAAIDPNDRAMFAPAAKRCLKALQLPGADVFPEPTDLLRQQLLRYYSQAVTPATARGEKLLRRMELPCNVSRVPRPVVKMHWDHIHSVALGGRDEPGNLQLVDSAVNLAAGEANTREWALANGYGALLTEPPTADELAASEALPWWDGRVAFDQTAPREQAVRAQYPTPWPVVTAQHQRLLRAAGQTPLRFVAASAVLAAPVVEAGPSVDPQRCHRTNCTKIVLTASGDVIPCLGQKVGRYHYCPLHAAQHARRLLKSRQRRSKTAVE